MISGADNGVRTRDPHLGKVMLYQLSHVRARRYNTDTLGIMQEKICQIAKNFLHPYVNGALKNFGLLRKIFQKRYVQNISI